MSPSKGHRLYNPSDTALVFDADGHQVDGYSSVVADPQTDYTRELIQSGRLLDKGAVPSQEG